MKKIIALLMVVVGLVSCSSDVTFNNNSLQAVKDNNAWKSSKTKIDNILLDGVSYMVIHAYRGLEQVDLTVKAPTGAISSTNPQTYYFGKEGVDMDVNPEIDYTHDKNYTAQYKFVEDDVTFSYATTESAGNGQLVITTYDPVNKKLSGTFRFNATYQGDFTTVPANVNFQQGYIFEIPVQ